MRNLEFDFIWEYTIGKKRKELHVHIGDKENEKILSYKKNHKLCQMLKSQKTLQKAFDTLKERTIKGFQPTLPTYVTYAIHPPTRREICNSSKMIYLQIFW